MTTGSFIYSDFFDDVVWLKDRLKIDFASLPDEVRGLGDYYLTQRLFILPRENQEVIDDPELGRPVPYAVFWLSEAMGGLDSELSRKLALAMVYSSIITTIRDDLEDDSILSKGGHERLYEYFAAKHIGIFRMLFPQGSRFWDIYERCEGEIRVYTEWRKASFDVGKIVPYGDGFLWDSSRYFSAVVFPSLAAVGVLKGQEEKIPYVEAYLRFFSMGWRVYDDLKDWRIDLKYEDLNRSSLLCAVRQRSKGEKVTESAVQSCLFDEKFIDETFGAVSSNFLRSIEAAKPLNSRYLTRFMEEQLSFHKRSKAGLLEGRSKFFRELEGILRGVAK
jgi:hypothetical protein